MGGRSVIKSGKQTLLNKKANVELKKQYLEAGIECCEVGLPGCWRNRGLSYAHKHKRIWYRACPELLYSIQQTVLACPVCHGAMEYDDKLTLQVFKRLRPKQTMPATKSISKKSKPATRSKKPDWFRPHSCSSCRKSVTGLLCPFCHQLSVKS